MNAAAFLELAVVLAFFASLGVLELVIKRMEKRRGPSRSESSATDGDRRS